METHANTLQSNFRLWLQSQLMERCRKNPRYSLRAFAALLEMEASSVSQIISGKRKAQAKVITHICKKLSVTPSQTNEFLSKTTLKKRNNSQLEQTEHDFALMAEDAFAYIANWYHAAILELTFTDSFELNHQWIAQTLSITVTEVKMAIERLIRLDLLKEEKGTLIKTNKFITNFAPGFTSSANREFQRQLLTKALEAIDHVPQEDKDITSMTMAIDVDKLPEARKIITKFRRDLSSFLETGEQTRVYNLGIQLYPLSHNKRKNS